MPTLNEILTQLHQDPTFRERYKEYCKAVLEGRINMGEAQKSAYEQVVMKKPTLLTSKQSESGLRMQAPSPMTNAPTDAGTSHMNYMATQENNLQNQY